MKAMVATALGGVDVLKMQSMPQPVPGEHDLLVEVHAAGVNPVDYKVRQSGLRVQRQFPFILGYDVSGVVVQTGAKVEGFRIGDEIYASPSLIRNGSNAEYVCVDARTAAIKPGTLTHEHAAALPLVTLTAWESLHDHARLHPSETVLIHAGGGGVGHIAIQLAKAHHSRVIATASRDESIELCRQLGADIVINYTKENVADRVMHETAGRGCNVVLDNVGGEVFQQCIPLVAVNGRLVTVAAGDTKGVEALFLKNASLHFEFMGVPTIHGINIQRQNQILHTASELVDAGKLKPHVSQILPLEQLPQAHRLLEARHVIGKIVVKVRD